MEAKSVTALQRQGVQAFREAVRCAPRLEAVILAIGAALQWAHHHGATTVEIRD